MIDENTEVRLDNPLVVHKKDDASYSDNTYDDKMSVTHYDENEEDTPTLERHRFKKKKNGHKGLWVFLIIIAVIVSVMCGLFYSGKLSFSEKSTTAPQKPERTYSTTQENKFKGIITVKNTFVFFEGKEVDGLKGLESEIKYLEKGTKFIIQDESADSNFLNYEVLSMLSQYNIDYDITYVVSSGLKSVYETTTATTTTTTSTTAKQAVSE